MTNTGQAGLFKIVGEESVAAGTRRITALTGPAALAKVQHEEALLAEVAATLKSSVGRSAGPRRGARQGSARAEKAARPQSPGEEFSAEKLLAEAEDVSGTKVIVAEVPGGTPPVLRQLIDQLRTQGDRPRPCCWPAANRTRSC